MLAVAACREEEPVPTDKPPPPPVVQTAHDEPAGGGTLAGAGDDAGRSDATGAPALRLAGEDADFLVRAAGVGAFEVGAAELAMQKGTHPTVIAYAKAMIRDHAQLAIALDVLATTKGLRISAGPDAAHRDRLRSLSMLQTGYAFDERYGDLMERSHGEAVRMFEDAVERTRDPDVRDFADSALQLLRSHGDDVDLIGADGIV